MGIPCFLTTLGVFTCLGVNGKIWQKIIVFQNLPKSQYIIQKGEMNTFAKYLISPQKHTKIVGNTQIGWGLHKMTFHFPGNCKKLA